MEGHELSLKYQRSCLLESQTATDRKEGCIVLCQKERCTCSDTATDLPPVHQAGPGIISYMGSAASFMMTRVKHKYTIIVSNTIHILKTFSLASENTTNQSRG